MSYSTTNTTSSTSPRPAQLVLRACQTDDVSLISQALSAASSLPEPSETIQRLLSQTVRQSAGRGATNVLTYALEHGAKIPPNILGHVYNPSIGILEILVSHGWDINARTLGEPPFLWRTVHDSNLVTWCLEHGATVLPRVLELSSDDERRKDEFGCRPLLEVAASQSTVSIFELLRSKGAQLGIRTLHRAAEKAHTAMVIHLVDTLGLDPNARDQPAGCQLGNHWGTPLCYLARSGPNSDCTEVTIFLLERGADPDFATAMEGWSAMEFAKQSNNRSFLDTVEAWKARQTEQIHDTE